MNRQPQKRERKSCNAVTESTIPALLQARAVDQPDTTAFTFVDYEVDPTGFAESLTWSQIHRRAHVVADELRLFGSVGDRAAILAPSGLDYIAAFLGALQAGFIAVPLSVPRFGHHDERVSVLLRDSVPAVILTTSAVVGDVTEYACAQSGHAAPHVVEIDSLDLNSPRPIEPFVRRLPKAAYLQYTSGSTRTPTGVVVSHRNVIASLEQIVADYFEDPDVDPPRGTTLVSWLPFSHDMGLIFGICAPILSALPSVLTTPMTFLQRPARWLQLLARHSRSFSAAPNFAFELAARRTSDNDLAGLDLGNVRAIVSGSERIDAATLKRFNDRFAPFNLSDTVVRPAYGPAEATVYVATPAPGSPAETVRFESEKLSAGYAKRCGIQVNGWTELVSHGAPRASTVRIVDPETQMENPASAIGEIWVHGKNVAMGYWHKPHLTDRTFSANLAHPSPGTPDGPWLRTGDLGVISEGELFIMGRCRYRTRWR